MSQLMQKTVETVGIGLDRESIEMSILNFYKNGWLEYDHHTLIEQTKDLEFPPKNAKSLPKEELIECLLKEDKQNLSKMTMRELVDELKAQRMN